jgi:excisionase family DNA binding protein
MNRKSRCLDTDEEGEWLSLSAAARLLDVHPTTLRRWANNGEIPTLVTPGGHRRFALAELVRFTRERSAFRNINSFAGLWATRAMAHTRREVMVHSQSEWLARFDDEGRENNRVLGRQLMGLTLQYISSDSSDRESEAILEDARRIGHLYAVNSIQHGLPLRAALEASMFFRDGLIDTALQLPETANIRSEANARLVRRINTLLNTVHLAIVETYEATSGDHSGQ